VLRRAERREEELGSSKLRHGPPEASGVPGTGRRDADAGPMAAANCLPCASVLENTAARGGQLPSSETTRQTIEECTDG